MKNQDLDNFFKSKSNSFNEMPPDDLWKKIQNNLSQEPKPKSNLKKTFFTMALPIITLISATILILNINNNPEKTNKTTLSNDSIKKMNSSIILDTNPNTTITKNIPDLDNKAIEDKKRFSTQKANEIINSRPKSIPFSGTSNFQEKIYSEDEVAIKPTFSGGLTKLYEFIIQNYRTPRDCPGGQITVTFVIEKDGSLTDIKTVKDIGFGTGEEAVRVLKECPKWIPGKHDGKIVRVQYTFPIAIQVDEANNDINIHSLAGIDVKPKFIGGITKFYEFIEQNYKIPKGCRGGKIYLTFIIEKDGSLSDVKSIRDVGFGSGDEAIRVLQKSPKWEPGEQNGKKVRVHYSIPISIKADVK